MDRELDPQATRAVAAHLEACTACRTQLRTLKGLKRAVASGPVAAMPPELLRNLRATAREADRQARGARPAWRDLWRPLALRWGLASAMAAGIFVVWIARDREEPLGLDAVLSAHGSYARALPSAAGQEPFAADEVESP